MKLKLFIILLSLLFVMPTANAQINKDAVQYNYDKPSVNWEGNGANLKKIYNVGYKILRKNNIRKRMVFSIGTPDEISLFYRLAGYADDMVPFTIPTISFKSQSFSYWPNRMIYIYPSLFKTIDSDDELAFLVAHEIAHTIDFYNWYAIHRYLGLCRPFSMRYIYEYRADNRAIDLMVNAGFNPMGAITYINKTSSDYADIIATHPNGSRRMKKIFKKISKNYPEYITSDYEDNIYFINFEKYYHKKRDKKIEKQKAKQNSL